MVRYNTRAKVRKQGHPHMPPSSAVSSMSRSGTLGEPVVKLTRLRHLRERAALSQVELAEKAGVARATLVLIEACKREPQPRTIRRLAEALGVAPADLMPPEDQD